jgi:subtilase family serine protease
MQFKAVATALLSVAFMSLSASAAVDRSGGTPPSIADGSAKLVQHADSNQMLRVVIGLERPHPDAEEQFLRDLHTKGTKEFHHFLKPEEWNARFAPSSQDEQAVIDWAVSQGLKVTNRFPHRLVVDVEGPVGTIEKAFNVTINNYRIGTATHFSNDRAPQIAGSVGAIVHSVLGLNDIQVMKPGMGGAVEPAMPIYSAGPAKGTISSGGVNGSRKRLDAAIKASSKKRKGGITNGFYDPTDLYGSNAYDFNALYAQGHCCNPFGNPGGTPPVTSIAIATAGAQNTNDFAGFQGQYPYLAYHWFTIPIDGSPVCCDNEGTLDFEWATAMSNSFGSFADTSSVFIYQGANNFFSTFTDIYSHMLADGNARTMSVSWGCAEFSCADNGTMDTEHGIFDAMVGQGWTLVGIAHDYGATADCSTISVSYPGSDPDLVSAGGTTLFLNFDSTYNSEVAWTGGSTAGSCAGKNGGGGGGCSQKFAAPGYQGSSPSCGTGSRSVPDISLNAAIGQNYYFNGGLGGVGGTSIVAPELAGFFAQENAYLFYENQVFVGNTCGNGSCAPMGNPNWYIYYEGLNAPYAAHYPFYDITSGCNSNDVTISKGLGSYCAFGGKEKSGSLHSAFVARCSEFSRTHLRATLPFSNVTVVVA